MKVFIFILSLLFGFACIGSFAQKPIIELDYTTGCDKITVHCSTPSSASPVWDINGQIINSQSFTLTDLQPKIYDVLLTVGADTAHRTILVGKTPKVSYTYSDPNAFGYNFKGAVNDTVSAISAYQFTWVFPTMTVGARSVFYDFGAAGNYPVKLIAKDIAGCKDSVTQIVQIADSLSVPNFFTPNGDGANDYFKIKSDGVSVISFKVFARSGLQIYETEGKVIEWDGRLNAGDEVAAGLYFYTLEIQGVSGLKKKGFFYLFR